MAKKKIVEGNKNKEINSPVRQNGSVYNKQINVKPAPKPKLGIDVDKDFYDTLIQASQGNKLDVGKLESFTQISQNRDQLYTLIDTMAEDSTIAAVLETYVEDATETGIDGRIVWAECEDPAITKYVTYLLDTMNIDKNAYKHVYSLVKYGDLYLRLYRESEYNDKLFDTTNEEDAEKHAEAKRLNEDLAKIMAGTYETPAPPNGNITAAEAAELDDLSDYSNDNVHSLINENVNIKLYSKNDRYVHYLEMIPNPAEMYELTKLGKTYAYIQAPTTVNLGKTNDILSYTNRYAYTFKRKDVSLYEATEFVHAALEDNSSRVPEFVNIFLTEEDYEHEINSLAYTVRRGQSLLYNSYKIWRELMLLEYSLLLNRVTKSSLVRIIGVEVGDMPKEQIAHHLGGIKAMMEQKSAINTGTSMSEYTNPGPIENNIYVPIHNGIGSISPQEIGGDINVSGLGDLDYFKNKFFGSLRVPKQFFGDTDDSGGFDAGTSLSIISSRYAKTVKRIQNTYVQALTDAINLILIDKGLISYVNKFTLKMVAPTTREELDRQDNASSKVQFASDIMMLVGDIKDLSSRLKVLKALLTTAAADTNICEIIQEEIDRLEALKSEGYELDENGDPIITEDDTDLTGSAGEFAFGGDVDLSDYDSDTSDTYDDGGGDLPSPDSLGVDFTDSDNF